MKQAIEEASNLYINMDHMISSDWTMDTFHFHDYFEINLSVSGRNKFFINDDFHEAKPMDIFLFNNEDLHQNIVSFDYEYERYVIAFMPSSLTVFNHSTQALIDIFYQDLKWMSLTTDEFYKIQSIIDDAINNSKHSVDENLYFQIKLIEVLMELNRIFRKTEQQPIKHLEISFSKKVIDFIDQNLDHNLTLDTLSKHFFINKTYLCDKFKKETGFTINYYLTHRRIIYAKSLLKQGYSVTDVSMKVGYNRDSHFIQTFKKIVGTTPKQYSLKHK